MKINKVCKTCGSEDVWADAIAVWDIDAQEWKLGAIYDYTHCDSCDGETHINDVQIPEELK